MGWSSLKNNDCSQCQHIATNRLKQMRKLKENHSTVWRKETIKKYYWLIQERHFIKTLRDGNIQANLPQINCQRIHGIWLVTFIPVCRLIFQHCEKKQKHAFLELIWLSVLHTFTDPAFCCQNVSSLCAAHIAAFGLVSLSESHR